jgi:hypothetical protein
VCPAHVQYDAANVLQDNAQDTLSRRLRKLEQ